MYRYRRRIAMMSRGRTARVPCRSRSPTVRGNEFGSSSGQAAHCSGTAVHYPSWPRPAVLRLREQLTHLASIA
jgi:hypothetical protein